MMSRLFCVTIHFLLPTFHGRGDQDAPEWPPSPLRLFQALTAAASARWDGRGAIAHARSALDWLERQPAPTIVAPGATVARAKYQLYVPDNTSDLTAKSWARGNTTEITNRAEKVVCPMRLPEHCTIHYLWPIDDDREVEPFKDLFIETARSITHLGWGVDMAAADASIITEAEAAKLEGERWRPSDDPSGTRLRIPIKGTLKALIDKHDAFLHRLGPDGFHPVPPLTVFDVVGYRRVTDPLRFPFAAFSLLRPDASGFRAFDTARRLKAVAGMLRHAARRSGEQVGLSDEQIDSWILGHAEKPGEPHRPVSGPRLAYVPLPSIQYRGGTKADSVTEIRRAIVMQFGGNSRSEFDKLMRLLGGDVLIPMPAIADHPDRDRFENNPEWGPPQLADPSEPIALLSRLPDSDKAVRRYTDSSSTWATVTPLVLPGYDDPRHYRRRLEKGKPTAEERKRLLNKLDERIVGLIRSAIEHAGYSPELARYADVEWRGSGFWPGTDLASRYLVPTKLERFSRLHVRITWRDSAGQPLKVPGPICLGGGRYFGFGLFAGQ